jgi:Holliday junction resolvasome RuvABC ATP-dependent DNA helicase subunit
LASYPPLLSACSVFKHDFTEDRMNERLMKTGEVFSPSAPIVTKDLFFGRKEQLARAVDAINEKGQHLVLYGERGVGKTSLANIFHDKLQGISSAKIVCNRDDTFESLWKKMLRRISFISKAPGMGFTPVAKEKEYQLDLFLSKEGTVDPNDLLLIFEKLSQNILFIFDEYDSVKDSKVISKMADVLKAVSDSSPQVTIMIVGITDNVNELIGNHPSIERCIKQIRLPRMSNQELAEIIDNGVRNLELEIEPRVMHNLIRFSQGFPHYTHLLAKYACQWAIRCDDPTITKKHFDLAISDAIENAQESIREAYQRAVLSTRKDTMFEKVIFACALVEEDEHGTFRATDLIGPLYKLTGKDFPLTSFTYHLGKLSKDERGTIIQKIQIASGNSCRFRFKNPLVKAYILLRLYQDFYETRQLDLF